MSSPVPEPTIFLFLSGPAGVGKSTLCDRMVREVPSFERIITATTRPPRTNEVDGRDYHFLTEAQFDARLASGDFLEWALVHKKHLYGTLKSAVLDRITHTNLICNLDVQGVRSIRAAAKDIPALREKVATIFVAPNSHDTLRNRLQSRGPVTADELDRRLKSAKLEMLERFNYDYIIHSGTKEQDFHSLLGYYEQAKEFRF